MLPNFFPAILTAKQTPFGQVFQNLVPRTLPNNLTRLYPDLVSHVFASCTVGFHQSLILFSCLFAVWLLPQIGKTIQNSNHPQNSRKSVAWLFIVEFSHQKWTFTTTFSIHVHITCHLVTLKTSASLYSRGNL